MSLSYALPAPRSRPRFACEFCDDAVTEAHAQATPQGEPCVCTPCIEHELEAHYVCRCEI